MEEPSFKLPEIIDNDNGWGPSPVMLPEKFRDIPYAPYSKADKLGRIADWSTPEQREKESSGRQRTNYRNYRGIILFIIISILSNLRQLTISYTNRSVYSLWSWCIKCFCLCSC